MCAAVFTMATKVTAGTAPESPGEPGEANSPKFKVRGVLTGREYLRRGHEISHLTLLMPPRASVAAGRLESARRSRLRYLRRRAMKT